MMLTTGEGTIGATLSLAQRSSRARRLMALEDSVAYALAEDQAFLVDGIIVAYEALACSGTLRRLEGQRRFTVDAAMAAPQVDAGTKHHDDDYPRSNRNGRDDASMVYALRRLKEVDVAIAWCEGKTVVTTQLFPPAAMGDYSQRGYLIPNEDGDKMFSRALPLASDAVSSNWQEAQELHLHEPPQKYHETPDGGMWSRSRSRACPGETRLSSPSYLAPHGGCEEMNALSLPSATAIGITPAVGKSTLVPVAHKSPEDHIVCNLGFDRWKARQIAVQVHFDKRRLWLLRCDAEEVVRRHTILMEERLGRITLLVTAREEVAAGVDAESRTHIVEPSVFWEKHLWKAMRWMQQQLDAQENFLASAISAVKKGAEEYAEACRAQLQGAAMYSCENGKKKLTRISCDVKKTPLSVNGPSVENVGWASYAHALLCDAEKSQRSSIEREMSLSWKLLLSRWQMVLNHVNSHRLIAAKESLIYELAADLNGCTSVTPIVPRSASSWVVASEREVAASERQPSKSQTPSSVHRTWAVEMARSRSARLQAVCTPPAPPPAKMQEVGMASSHDVSPCEMESRTALSGSGEHTVGSLVSLLNCAMGHLVANASQSPPPIHKTRWTGNSNDNEIALHICMSVELVERKQVTLLEQRAWGEITARFNKNVMA
ncbi:hypothetical protein MOQ_000961 [Trypanosoma cruzi marinkellei]|uniref:Uncharacterized protein n=1 Tax=Trypanosoma cruzi marinkellei TaxID=85056 RepID=K2NHF7_TRYCR|nr:hypothetical protein MOQ_000961 [Trypanosoma cruzi marinkellei]